MTTQLETLNGLQPHQRDQHFLNTSRRSQAEQGKPNAALPMAMTRALEIGDVELLEREREQAELAELLAAACGGAGQFVIVEGVAGIGKTRLLDAVRAEAKRAGMQVLAARGMDLECGFIYGVVRQLFESVVVGVDEATRVELFSGAAGQAASLFTQVDPAGEPSEAEDASFAMLHGLFWLTANLCARQPVVLCVDDLHWADAPSLRFLAYLLPRLEGLGLFVVVGLRPAEPGADQHLLTRIVTDPVAKVVRLAPLSQEGSGRLVRALLGDQASDAFCAACHEATGGNPLLLRELAAVVAAEGLAPTAAAAGHVVKLGPRVVGRRVRLRLARLGPAGEAVCEAVAILGDGAEPAHMAALAGLEFAEAVEVARQLIDAGILYRRGQAHGHGVLGLAGVVLGFIHPLVREAVYEGLSETARLAGHAHAARLLDEVGAPVEQVAAHLLLIPPMSDPAVVAALRRAADEAVTRGSPDSAVLYLERCLAEPLSEAERAEALLQLGAAARLIDMAKAEDCLAAVLAVTEQPERRAVIAETLGRTLWMLGRCGDAVEVLSQAAGALGEEQADLRWQLEAGLVHAAMADPALHGLAAGYAGRLRDVPSDPGVGGRMVDTVIALYDTLAGEPAEAVAARARRGVADGVLIERSCRDEVLAPGYVALIAADVDEVMLLFDAWLAQADRRGSILAVGIAKGLRGLAWMWRGFLAQAEADLREAMWAIETTGAVILRALVGAWLADVLMEQGRLDEAEEVLGSVGPPEPLLPAGYWHWVLDSRAQLLMLRGRFEEGLEAMVACGRRFAAHGGQNPALVGWRSGAALALWALDRRGEARVWAGEEVELARRWGAPRALGRALRVAGVVQGGEEGLGLLREAVGVLEASPARLEYAKALVELGGALRRAGQRGESRECLRRGVEQAQACGAAPLVKRGRDELRVSGVRPRQLELLGPAALTPGERRVAELAAEGLSNREIARRLVITVNTVEAHLTRTYRKLGISGRAELAQVLSDPA